MTGQDMAAWFRGRYATRKAAMALVRERAGRGGVKAVAEYAAVEFEMPLVPIALARRGDMVLLRKGTEATLGIVSLTGMDVMCAGSKGIVRVAFDHATAAWRV